MTKSFTVRFLFFLALGVLASLFWSGTTLLYLLDLEGFFEGKITPVLNNGVVIDTDGFYNFLRLWVTASIPFGILLIITDKITTVFPTRPIRIVFRAFSIVALFCLFPILFVVAVILFNASSPISFIEKVSFIGLEMLKYLSVAFLPAIIVYQWECINETQWYRRLKLIGGGSARLGSIRSFAREKVEVFPLRSSLTSWLDLASYNIVLGRTFFFDDPFRRNIGIHDDAHIITIGMTGSGKAATSATQNLGLYAGSMVVIDPKGEHARTTFKRRQLWVTDPDKFWEMGYRSTSVTKAKCYMLDPYGVNADTDLPRHCYNPLADIPKDHENAALDMIQCIADGCVIPESKDNTHFSDYARKFITALIAHVVTFYPEDCHTLPFCYDLYYGIDPETGRIEPDGFENLLIDMCTNKAFGNLINGTARDILDMGDNEKGSVLSSISKSLEWIAEPNMRKQLSKSDFSFRDFGHKVAVQQNWNRQYSFFGKSSSKKRLGQLIETLYVVLPFHKMQGQSRWMRIISSVSIQSLTTIGKKPSLPTVLLLDEFAQMGGRVQAVANAFNIARSAGIKLWIFLQNLDQIKVQYKEWNDMISGSTVQLFGVNDMTTAKYFSERLGNMSYERRERKEGGHLLGGSRVVSESLRPLYSPDGIMELLSKSSNTQLVFRSSGRPLFLERLGFIKFSMGKGAKFNQIEVEGKFDTKRLYSLH